MLVGIKSCRACGQSFSGAEVFCPEDGSRLLTLPVGGELEIDSLIGSTIGGRYRVLRMIGQGGMGIVYEAEHLMIERRVAIKVLREDFCRRADVVERFRREAKSASRIGHPNIVDVLDFGQTPDGASYFVMEMLAGQDLADVLASEGALSPERATAIAFQCCHALGVAHERGIVHRDLKPENILLLNRDGFADFVKIVDFGVAKISDPALEAGEGGTYAKLTRTGVIFGTPEYMSPEQAAGLVPDHRVDIYALGVTLYELLSGRVPFEGESFMSVLSKHANKQVPALRDIRPGLKISAELEGVVFRALRKERDERFQSMSEMAAALQQVPEMPSFSFRLSFPPTASRASQPEQAPERGPATLLTATSAASDVPRSLAPRARGIALGIALAALLSGASFALFFAERRPSTRSGSARSTSPLSKPALTLPRQPAEPQAAELPARGAALVTIQVTTDPIGASVRIEGGAEVCATTPCAFEVVQGVPIALQARRGLAQARTTLNPMSTTELHLVLNAPARTAVSRARPSQPRDDLKVPEIFRDGR